MNFYLIEFNSPNSRHSFRRVVTRWKYHMENFFQLGRMLRLLDAARADLDLSVTHANFQAGLTMDGWPVHYASVIIERKGRTMPRALNRAVHYFPLSLTKTLHWIEIPRNDGSFLSFLAEVVTLLDKPTPPDPQVGCPWCRYRWSSN
jgi:hypothetical protein